MGIQRIAERLVAKSTSFHKMLFENASQIFEANLHSREALTAHLENPPHFLRWLFRFYAFARQIDYGAPAEAALRALLDRTPFEDLIANPTLVIREFDRQCVQRSWVPNPKGNHGVIEGLLKLAGQHQHIPTWAKGLLAAGRVEELYLQLLSVKGLGEKIPALILRDLVWLYDLEEAVPIQDRLYLQPIDIWVKRIFHTLWPGLPEKLPSLVIAKRIAEACRRWGLSGVRFNQGAWWFASQEIPRTADLTEALLRLAE